MFSTMNKVRQWFNKPKKRQEVENQLMIQPLTPEKTRQAPHGVVTETLSSAPDRLAALLSDLRGSIGRTGTDGSGPDVTLTARLSMLRELLQGDITQEQEVSDVQQQRYPPQHLSPQTSAPLPVWRSQVDTGSCDIISPSPGGGGATNTAASSPGLPGRPFLRMGDDRSLPSSPHPGGRGRRLPCSLPCSPLLGGRRWRSSPSSPSSPSCPSPPSGLSRLWLEEALQRSKNIRQTEPRPLPACPTQVRQGEEEEEGVMSRWGEAAEEDKQEENKEVETVNTVGIRLSDTVIFRPMTCGREEEEEEEEEEESDVLCSEPSRCPSAPPYEAEVFSAGERVPSFGSEDQKHGEGSDTQGSEGGGGRSLPRDGAPQLGGTSRLYPSLSLWRKTTETDGNRKQEEEPNSFGSQLHHNTAQSRFHGNRSHLQQLSKMLSGVPGELTDLCFILKKVFDSTTCSRRTAPPVESCSFCSDEPCVHILRHVCRNCDQVFCGRCVSRFVSLLQIHQLSQTAAV